MSHQHSLEKVRRFDGHDLKGYCKHDRRCMEIRETGDHVVVQGPMGSAVFPDRTMGKGLWCTVIKQIISIGLGVFVLAVLLGLAGLL